MKALRTKSTRFAMLLLVVSLLFTCGCGTNAPATSTASPDMEPSAEPVGQTYQDGVYSASAQGFGGTVTVSVTLEKGQITECEIQGDDETPTVGGEALDKLQEQILTAQSAGIDGVSGATYTGNAVKQALQSCLNQASGVTGTVEVKMKPGTYEGEGTGYSLGNPDKVSVTVSESEILSIEIAKDSGDTGVMLDSVKTYMLPRILESQSIAVDATSGATSSANGVRAAVRDCLTQALAAGGSDSSAISAFTKTVEKTPKPDQTIETDILVIGMGGSGTYTALRAAECGATVLAIDKEARYGGTTVVTSLVGAVNPPKVEALYNGGQDYMDAEDMRRVWLEHTGGDEKSELVDLYIDSSGVAFDWLVSQGAYFTYNPMRGFDEIAIYPLMFPWYPSAPEKGVTLKAELWGGNKSSIQSYFDTMVNTITSLGGTYMLETEGYELLTDDSGAVVGAKARNVVDSTEYTIQAKAVVLACGGFIGNGEMLETYLSDEYYPLKGTWKTIAITNNDGKMLQAALDIGAGTKNIGMTPEVHVAGSWGFLTGFEIHRSEDGVLNHQGKPYTWSVADLPMYLGLLDNSLAVGTDGNRFTSEAGLDGLDSWKAGPCFYSIWSTDQLNEIRDNGLPENAAFWSTPFFLGYQGAIPNQTPLPETYDVLEAGIEAGWIYKADTIEELASLIDVDPTTLTATVETYNGYCADGVDAQYGKDAASLATIGDGAFYAIKMAPYAYSTTGGLNVDTSLRVLKADGTAIEGLYSVGNDSAGVLMSEKEPYLTFGGIANGWALTSGYVCGEAAAAYAASK